MTTYANPELYNPEGAVDQIVADGDLVVLMDTFSSNFATVIANAIYSYSPTITKVAFNGGYRAEVSAMTNQIESTNSGNVNHWAIVDTVNSKVLEIGESTGEAITAGDPFNIPAFSARYPATVSA